MFKEAHRWREYTGGWLFFTLAQLKESGKEDIKDEAWMRLYSYTSGINTKENVEVFFFILCFYYYIINNSKLNVKPQSLLFLGIDSNQLSGSNSRCFLQLQSDGSLHHLEVKRWVLRLLSPCVCGFCRKEVSW